MTRCDQLKFVTADHAPASLKYLFIAGLEHSGTTLLNILLGLHPEALGLGEVAAFFSPSHIRHYLEQWGAYPDARECSCGESWQTCEFWRTMEEFSGINSQQPVHEKYARLIKFVRARMPRSGVIVDSSKNLPTLKMLLAERDSIGLSPDDLHVVLAVKDVRGFAASIQKKNGRKSSLFSHLRTFNWWVSENRDFMACCEELGDRFQIVTYESMCRDPLGVARGVLGRCGLQPADLRTEEPHRASHLVMGNKEAIRTRHKIRYDDRWRSSMLIRLAYTLHPAARRLNLALGAER